MAAGVESAYKVMKKKGKTQDNFKILGIGGDGGTYDIGFQSLSGALERGHDFTYFCYDNEAYMNTGTQRSSATPRFAHATTTPAGVESVGKKQKTADPWWLTAPLMWLKPPFSATSRISMRRPTKPSTRKAPPLSTCSAPAPGAGSIPPSCCGDLPSGGGHLHLAPL